MDGRRRRRTGSAGEGLALVKAAAWAWYQRGSGNEGRAARESDVARPGRLQPRPSRFKLEAAAATAAAAAAGGHELLGGVSPAQRSQSGGHAGGAEKSFPQERCKVERVVGRQMGGVAVVPRRGGSLYRVAGGRGGRKQGFWVRHAARFCGSGADVAEARALVGGRRPHLRLGP